MLDERQLARFKNEALAAAQLQHPNIVPIYAVGCERGLHFYVMQLIEGETLEQLIHEPRMPVVDAQAASSTSRLPAALTVDDSTVALARIRRFARWIAQAAEALDHAHNQGIVHRDVKPSNLMIGRDGDLWVTDFGLARTARDAAMTASGELLGTLRYMSPEQLRSKPGIVDHRTDIFSLGLTLYELVARRPAFDGQTQPELMRRIEHDDVASLARFDARVPRDLDSIVSKATAKCPRRATPRRRKWPTTCGRSWRADRRWLVRPPGEIVATNGFTGTPDSWPWRELRLRWCSCARSPARCLSGRRRPRRSKREGWRATIISAEENLDDARHAVDDVFTGVAGELADVPGAENVRRQLLSQALSYYKKFIAQAASNPRVRAETAAAYYRCGQISEQLGDDDAASAAYEAAKQVFAAIQAGDPGQDQLETLALCENNVGLIHLRAGRFGEAEARLRDATDIARKIAMRDPHDDVAKCHLALSFANLGMVLGQQGAPARRETLCRRRLNCNRKSTPPPPWPAAIWRPPTTSLDICAARHLPTRRKWPIVTRPTSLRD